MWHKAAVFQAALVAAFACVPAQGAQRAFVASTGSDANACTPSAPCRSFQAAHASVDAGGEIVALDAAGYGAVTITKSVSILGNPGFITSISVGSGDGVTITTGGVNVVLRNLYINGIGGSTGINMNAGTSLTIENCVVANFAHAGVRVNAAARVRIIDSTLRGNQGFGAYVSGNAVADVINSRFTGTGGVGMLVEGSSAGITTAAVSGSTSSGNNFGFYVNSIAGSARLVVIRSTAANNTLGGIYVRAEAGSTAAVGVGSSMVSGNYLGFGVDNSGGGTTIFESLGNNLLRQNDTNADGTITVVSGL
jgi:hypothetical protein